MSANERAAQDFMENINRYTSTKLDSKSEKQTPLPPRYTWDGDMDKFKDFHNQLEGHYQQVGAGYLFRSDFQRAYLLEGPEYYSHFSDFVRSKAQMITDIAALYGALKAACKRGVGKSIPKRYSNTQDGLKAWLTMVKKI